MKPNQLIGLIESRYRAGIRRALLVESSPGIGKTQIAAQAARCLGIGFKAIHAPMMQPEDYGFPVISSDRTNVTFIASKEKFPLVGSDCPDTGILLIDEMPQADASSQKVLANLVQEREIHGHRLKDGWMLIATGNRVSDRAGASRMLTHLRNKITTITLEPSLDDWSKWALENGVKPEVVAFIRFRPSLLNDFDANREANPTPRAWSEGVSASLGTISSDLEYETFSGDVGEGPAAEFVAFLKVCRKLPSPDAILLAPTTSPLPDSHDAATQYAICGALSSRANAQNFGRVMLYIARLPKEFGALFIKDVVRRCPEIQTTQAFIQWASTTGAELFS